jgi:hypothetical protein
MPIDFPSDPTEDQIYTYEGKSWIYNGFAWDVAALPVKLNVEFLVIGGGGGGGATIGGGGGAGGYTESSNVFQKSTNYAVVVGAGGARAVTTQTNGFNGTTSSFSVFAGNGVGGGGGGAILQVVSNTKTNIFVSSSIASAGTVAITDLEVTITPSSIDSKILIQASIFGDTVSSDIAYILLKNGSDLTAATGDADGVRKRITSAALNRATTPILFLDSPASTSPLTYSISAFNRSVNANVLYVNRSASTDNIASQIRGISTITAMEVIA